MLTENEKRLIEAMVDSGFDKKTIISTMSCLEIEQMPEMTEYIREELELKGKISESQITKATLILLREAGKI